MPPRVALFGHGAMGRRHAAVLEGRAEVVIVDPAVGVAALEGAVDAAIVAVPAGLHAAVATPLLGAGVPCLVEKPVATTLDEADALAAHPQAWVGHVERFNPAFVCLRAHAGTFPWSHAAFRREGPRPARGVDLDVALDLLVHDLDLLAQLAPGDPVVRMAARPHPAEGLAREEGIVVDLVLASGRTAAFSAARGLPEPRRTLVLGVSSGNDGSHEARWADLLARAAWAGATPLPIRDHDALRAQDAAFLARACGGIASDGVDAPLATAGEGRDAVVLALRALHLRDRVVVGTVP